MTTPNSPTSSGNRDPSPGKSDNQNAFGDLLFNIAIPTLILIKFSKPEYLGTVWGLVVALAFPVGWGLKDFIRQKKINFFSVIGLVSILLTGGIGLLQLPPEYLAIKEAAIPGLLGIAVLGSLLTPYPLIRTLIFNEKLMQVEKITQALEQHRKTDQFEKATTVATLIIAGSFFVSSTLNYWLAITIVTGEPGSVEFNEQLGKMTALSFPVIAVPSMLIFSSALYYLYKKITQMTHLELEDILRLPEDHSS